MPPYMNFAPLKNGVDAVKASTERYEGAFAKWQASGNALPAQSATALDEELIQIQRAFLTEKGLPERPWFKNQVYAPGAYTGYGAKPIAAVREYMDQEKWKEADAEIPMVAAVLNNVAAAIDRAAAELQKATIQ
jgi:N-acetylated-alpha-linked acidic dipeptidase